MAKVGIVMGSDSDMPVMAKAAEILDKFGIVSRMCFLTMQNPQRRKDSK